jgi:hypothetical protein
MKNYIVLFAITFISFGSQAQKKSLSNTDFALTTLIKTGVFAPSVSATKYFSLNKKKDTKFKIGVGARLGLASHGYCSTYKTAPASLTKNVATVDSLGLDNSSVINLNALFAFQYQITSKINAEFNIDFFGLSFGGKQNAYLRNEKGVDNTTMLTTAKPTTGNILLVGDNDRGTLNSALNFTYKVNNHWKALLGGGFLFTEYTLANDTYINTANTVVSNNRFRNKSMGVNLGVIYNF